jgi:hypothetical protein
MRRARKDADIFFANGVEKGNNYRKARQSAFWRFPKKMSKSLIFLGQVDRLIWKPGCFSPLCGERTKN